MWEGECSTRGLSRPVRCFASRYVGEAIWLTMGQKDAFLVNFWQPV
jgi:hypothetical protein